MKWFTSIQTRREGSHVLVDFARPNASRLIYRRRIDTQNRSSLKADSAELWRSYMAMEPDVGLTFVWCIRMSDAFRRVTAHCTLILSPERFLEVDATRVCWMEIYVISAENCILSLPENFKEHKRQHHTNCSFAKACNYWQPITSVSGKRRKVWLYLRQSSVWQYGNYPCSHRTSRSLIAQTRTFLPRHTVCHSRS